MNWFWTKEMANTNPYYTYILGKYANADDHLGQFWNYASPYKNNWKNYYS
jgi:hypothetical protein